MIKSARLVWPISIGMAFIFQWLFYDKTPGINYAVFSVFILALLFTFNRQTAFKPAFIFVGTLYTISTLTVVFANTGYGLFIYWLLFMLLIGIAGYTELKHIQLVPVSFLSSFQATVLALKKHGETKGSRKALPYVKFIFLPVLTVLLLLVLYSSSNKFFAESIQNLLDPISSFFKNISWGRAFFTFLGLILMLLFLLNKTPAKIITLDGSISFQMIRVKNKRLNHGLHRLLIKKKQVALTTFVVLNVMIAWLNYLDITHIWINFKWDGGFLKDMLHTGINTLIFAILISIGITLFYLKSNVAFLRNNKLFNGLLIAWLLQNMLMAVSVIIRNGIYINHFALAYKRIFVYFFLAAAVFGLISIIYKIIYRRSVSFLMSANLYACLLIMVAAACLNWDRIIARYNTSNYQHSFLHFEFIARLNDSALPYLKFTEQELDSIYAIQKKQFSFVSGREFESIDYGNTIKQRQANFIKRWETKTIMEWNYPEYLAYRELKEGK